MPKGMDIKLKTELRDRNLWFDGIIEVSPEKVADLLLSGMEISDISVTDINTEIEQFNAVSGHRLSKKINCKTLDTSFLIPDKYKNLDLHTYFKNLQALRNDNDFENERRYARIENELVGFYEKKYTEVLKTIIYLIDTFREKNVVWGVGRGSSCASYLLFLTGTHLVDPVKYDIHYSEFLHD